MEEREDNRGREVGRAAVRLNTDKRYIRGVVRRRRRGFLKVGGGREWKYKDRGSE